MFWGSILICLIFYSSLIYKTLEAQEDLKGDITNTEVFIDSYSPLLLDNYLLSDVIENEDIEESIIYVDINAIIRENSIDFTDNTELDFEIDEIEMNNDITEAKTSIPPMNTENSIVIVESNDVNNDMKLSKFVNTKNSENRYISIMNCGMYTEDWLNELNNKLTNASEEDKLLDDWNEANSIYYVINYLKSAATGSGTETVMQMIAKVITTEIGGLTDDRAYQNSALMEKAAVAWCIYNRADTYSIDLSNPQTISKALISVSKAPNQFAYSYSINPMGGLTELALDVTIRWVIEQWGFDSGRILPNNYLWFGGDGKHNNFRDAYSGGNRWTWEWVSPYITD